MDSLVNKPPVTRLQSIQTAITAHYAERVHTFCFEVPPSTSQMLARKEARERMEGSLMVRFPSAPIELEELGLEDYYPGIHTGDEAINGIPQTYLYWNKNSRDAANAPRTSAQAFHGVACGPQSSLSANKTSYAPNSIIASVTLNLQSQMERLMECMNEMMEDAKKQSKRMNEMTEDAKKQSERIDGLDEFNKRLVYQSRALALHFLVDKKKSAMQTPARTSQSYSRT
ncbi:hypothetical protein K439DRAFT_994841 [Ramaria rubella]|nr:hypothetical protein K439DRAFT_994841 [Ramaria rubella]